MENTAKQEILTAIGSLSDRMDRSEGTIMEAIGALADHMDDRFAVVERDIVGIKSDIVGIKADMVTKDYLDRKLAIQHSEIVKFVQKRVPEWVKGRV